MNGSEVKGREGKGGKEINKNNKKTKTSQNTAFHSILLKILHPHSSCIPQSQSSISLSNHLGYRSSYHISNRSRVGLPPSLDWIFPPSDTCSRLASIPVLLKSIFLVMSQVEAYMLTLDSHERITNKLSLLVGRDVPIDTSPW